MKAILTVFTILVSLSFATSLKAETIIYVREGGTGDGSSWAEAMGSIRSAVFSIKYTGGEVWAAQGTYREKVDVFSGVKLFGGFPSSGEPAFTDRLPDTYKTIISGDINGDDVDNDGDGYSETNRDDNIAIILNIYENYAPSGETISSDPVYVDGLYIEGAQDSGAFGYDAAIVFDARAHLANCTFRDNGDLEDYGNIAIYFQGSGSMTNCHFIGHATDNGFAIISTGTVHLYDSTFTDTAKGVRIGSSNYSASYTSPVNVVNCVFDASGLEIRNTNPTIVNSLILNGSLVTSYGEYTKFVNCTFFDAMLKALASDNNVEFTFANTVLINTNYTLNQSPTTVSYLNSLSNTTDYGGTNIMADPLFLNVADPDGPDNIWFTVDDGLQLTEDSRAIDFGENTALIDDVADLDGDGDVDEVIPFDVLGNARLVGAKVDAGAYEFDGTDPNDSDGDGLPDTWEQLLVDADPNDAITTVAEVLGTDDFDGDGLSNLAEFMGSTSAIKWDSDGDGYSDKQELDVGYDPNSALSRPEGFHIVTAIELRFWGTPNKSYQVQYSDDFETWTDHGDPIAGQGRIESLLISFEGENKKREQYRIVTSD